MAALRAVNIADAKFRRAYETGDIAGALAALDFESAGANINLAGRMLISEQIAASGKAAARELGSKFKI